MDVGHGGSSGRFESLKEVALEYAFYLSWKILISKDYINIKNKKPY